MYDINKNKGNYRICVGHLIHNYLFITGSWIYNQLIGLSRYNPIVLTSALENLDEFPLNDIYCYKEPFPGSNFLKVLLRKEFEFLTHFKTHFFVDKLLQHNSKLLHAHFGDEGYYNLFLAKKTKLPMITTFYGYDVSMLPKTKPKWKERYKKLFGKGTLFLVEGSHMAQCLVDLCCEPQKIVIQHLGIDLNRIKFRPREKLHNNEPIRLLIAASFREKKGIPYCIKAFASVTRKYKNIELIIIGGAQTQAENKLMNICKKIVISENIANKVYFLGYIPYSQYLKEAERAHILLAHSITAEDGDTEGGAPVALIEASAMGMPIIATHHCDIPEVVINEKSGILVKERDVKGLADSILQMVTSPEIWPQMGETGRQHIESNYDMVKQIALLEKIYDAYISG